MKTRMPENVVGPNKIGEPEFLIALVNSFV